MTIKTVPIRRGWRANDYPTWVHIHDLKLGDVVELEGVPIWNRCIVTDMQKQNDDFPSVETWRPHVSLQVLTRKKEQPALQYEIFPLCGAPCKVIGNVGIEWVREED